jgi:hypothetical protein
MANVGQGAVRLLDSDGDALDDGAGRLKVVDDSFSTWETWAPFQVKTATSSGQAVALTDGTNGVNDTFTDAKEILLHADDANSSYIMVGHSNSTTIANSTITNRKGIKLTGGQMLILSISTLANIFTAAETSGQYLYVAGFK